MKVETDNKTESKFDTYPSHIRPKLLALRSMVIERAREMGHIKVLEETLKWGEPSYLAKKGSTIRMDWKSKTPDQYAIYFKCTSKLVSTFKEIYGDTFNYENTRAIVFSLEDEVPKEELKNCIGMALNYHNLKHLPLLGYESALTN